MSGLVAIIAHAPDGSIAPSEIRALAEVYESLRGGGRRREAAAAGRARLITIDRADADQAVIQATDGPRGASWAAATGAPHGARSLVGAGLGELDGQFALVSFDATTGEVAVASDPFGMHPLYAASRDGRTYVSTSAMTLARHLGSAPSAYGLGFFLRAGFHSAPRTHWDAIHRLNPGTVVRFGARGPRSEVYWRPPVDRELRDMPFDRAVDRCLEIAVEAFRSAWSGAPRAWTDLTGGLDSRLMNLLLAEAGVEFATHTRDEEPEDARLASRIAEAAGWSWDRVALPPDWDETVPGMLRTAVSWADGTLEVLELSWVLWAHAHLAQRHPRLLSGGGGEHLRNFTWLQEQLRFRAGRTTKVNLDDLIRLRFLRTSLDRTLLASDPTEDIVEELRTRLASWAEPYADEPNTTQLDVLYAYRYTGHFGAYHGADYAFLTAELPFYLKPVFTAAFSTNFRFRNRGRLMRQLMARLDRRLADLPSNHGGTAGPLRPGNAHHFLRYCGVLGRKAVNKLALSRGLHLFPTTARFQPAGPAARRAVLRSMFGDGPIRFDDLRSGPLYQPRRVEAFLRRAATGQPVDTVSLGRVLTVELVLRETESSL